MNARKAVLAVVAASSVILILTCAMRPGENLRAEGPVGVAARGDKELKIDLGQGISLEMVRIEPGEFMMGSPVAEKDRQDEERLHRVRITKGFYIGKYEVTQAQYLIVMDVKNPCAFPNLKAPVERVSWDDSQRFIGRLNQRVKDGGFRLPTEAEWEYACRAGSKTAFCFGDEEATLGAYAWYGANSNVTTHEVGQKRPNAWGLYDMHGNVWEWCQDWWQESYYEGSPENDPPGANAGTVRVLRGGGWGLGPWDCRSANRRCATPDNRSADFGFRVALDLR